MKGYEVDPVRAAKARLGLAGEDGQPLKQVDAAALLGVHAITLNRIENGKAKVSRDLLERMAELYGQPVEWLRGGDVPVDEFERARALMASSLTSFSEALDLLNARLGEAVPSADCEAAA